MEFILAALTTILINQPAQVVQTVPPNVVEFRQQLERMRMEIVKKELGIVNVVKNKFTREDSKFFINHVSEKDATDFNEKSVDFMDSLNKTIVDLGGSDTPTEDEKQELIRSMETGE